MFLTVAAALFVPQSMGTPLPSSAALSPAFGNLTGSPGDIVVLGIDIPNIDSSWWWVITSVRTDYLPSGAPGDILTDASAFSDYLSPYFLSAFFMNNTALAPGQTIYQGGGGQNNPGVGTPGVDAIGLGSFAISSAAAAGMLSFNLQLFYDVYDGNPFDLDPLAQGNLVTIGAQFDIPVSITVGASGVPEPPTVLLAGLALTAFGWVRVRSGRHAAG